MQPTYVIAWKSKSRGSTGQGKTLFSREEAEQVAKELNEDHPDFLHEPLKLGGPSTPAPAPEPETIAAEDAALVMLFPGKEEVFA